MISLVEGVSLFDLIDILLIILDIFAIKKPIVRRKLIHKKWRYYIEMI